MMITMEIEPLKKRPYWCHGMTEMEILVACEWCGRGVETMNSLSGPVRCGCKMYGLKVNDGKIIKVPRQAPQEIIDLSVSGRLSWYHLMYRSGDFGQYLLSVGQYGKPKLTSGMVMARVPTGLEGAVKPLRMLFGSNSGMIGGMIVGAEIGMIRSHGGDVEQLAGYDSNTLHEIHDLAHGYSDYPTRPE